MIWDETTLLMVDPLLIAHEENTSLVREEAIKHEGNPLVGLEDKPLTLGGRAKSLGYTFVVKQSGTYRMWYQIRGAQPDLKTSEQICKDSFIAYAESEDGIRFKPVKLGQMSFNGSKRNNLVNFDLPDGSPVRVCGFMRDPLDKTYPFKCLYYRPAKGEQMEPGVLARYPSLRERNWWFVWGIGRSKDGLDWEPPRHKHNLINTNPEHAKMHRALDGGIVMADQMMSPMADWSYRNVKGWITYDEETAHRIPDYLFSVPQHMARVYQEFCGCQWDHTPWIQPHIGLICARKGPTVLGLNGYLFGCGGAETFAQVAEVGLCVSDTGIKFREVWPFRPFIRRGPRPSWDFGMAAQCGIMDDGDQTRFYYIGGDVGNLSSVYLPGLAYIPRDRYGYRLIRGYRDTERRDKKGTFELTPFKLPPRPRFAVNVDNAGRGRTVQLELADTRGRVLPGYRFAGCTPVTRSGLKQRVRWKNNKTGAELAGRSVRIRVRLSGKDCGAVYEGSPRIYAIYTA